MLLIATPPPLPTEQWCLGSSWIAKHKKGAVSIWWEQIIKCINCVSTLLQSHLAYCQGPIRFLWFYVQKIICSVVNGTGIFAGVCVRKIIFFLSRIWSGLSYIWVQSCLFKILQLGCQLHFWSVSFSSLLQWIQQSEQQWCWFIYQWWGKTRYWSSTIFCLSSITIVYYFTRDWYIFQSTS